MGAKKGSRDSASSPWMVTYYKHKFFSRLVRLIKGKRTKLNSTILQESVRPQDPVEDPQMRCDKENQQKESPSSATSDVFAPDAEENRSRGSALRQAVKHVHFGSREEKCRAAVEIQRIAKEDVRMRKSLALFGVIPSLVAMLDSPVLDHRHSALQALIELANGNYTNKALIVEAGAVQKLSKLLRTTGSEMEEQIAIALLAISALDKNKSIIGSSGVIPELICMLESGTEQGRMASLATLFNLSTCLDNVESMVTEGAIQRLLKMARASKTAERALTVLGNLVVTEMGRKAMEKSIDMPRCLIDILGWENQLKCQELAAYILMILAHRSSIQRQAMMQGGIVPVLLELALLGTDLAQKRAMRLLQCLRHDRQAATMPVSGPVTARVWDPRREFVSSTDNISGMKEHKRAVKGMVQQSLQRNMEHILKRANVSSTYVDSSTRLKSLMCSSSSKSLPYL